MTKKPAQLCITRHGETDWNADGILQGWLDVPINQKGRRQARELAAKFQGQGFSHIYSSTLCRALETAQIISARLALPLPIALDGLMERNFGVIQGIPKQELAELNPIFYQLIVTRNPACSFEEGETMDEFADRILQSLMDIAEARPGKRVLIITHGWVLDVVTRHVTARPRTAILHTKPKNGDCLWVEATRKTVEALAQPG